MAFVNKQFGINRDATAGTLPISGFSYWNGTDTIIDIVQPGYFNDLADRIHQGDSVWVHASDRSDFIQFTSANGVTPVTTKIVSGPQFVGQGSYGGGGTSHAITVTGLVATDTISVTLRASTNACSIEKCVVTPSTITVHFSADPGAGTLIDYIVFR